MIHSIIKFAQSQQLQYSKIFLPKMLSHKKYFNIYRYELKFQIHSCKVAKLQKGCVNSSMFKVCSKKVNDDCNIQFQTSWKSNLLMVNGLFLEHKNPTWTLDKFLRINETSYPTKNSGKYLYISYGNWTCF